MFFSALILFFLNTDNFINVIFYLQKPETLFSCLLSSESSTVWQTFLVLVWWITYIPNLISGGFDWQQAKPITTCLDSGLATHVTGSFPLYAQADHYLVIEGALASPFWPKARQSTSCFFNLTKQASPGLLASRQLFFRSILSCLRLIKLFAYLCL